MAIAASPREQAKEVNHKPLTQTFFEDGINFGRSRVGWELFIWGFFMACTTSNNKLFVRSCALGFKSCNVSMTKAATTAENKVAFTKGGKHDGGG
jgi:hypothetical protein